MTRKRGEISALKLKMFDIYVIEPNCTNSDMAKRLGVDEHTVAKWKKEWEVKLSQIKHTVEQKIEQATDEKGSIFQKIIGMLGGVFYTRK